MMKGNTYIDSIDAYIQYILDCVKSSGMTQFTT